jgi:hypothetical protein
MFLRPLTFLAIPVLLLATACGGSDDTSSTTTPDTTSADTSDTSLDTAGDTVTVDTIGGDIKTDTTTDAATDTTPGDTIDDANTDTNPEASFDNAVELVLGEAIDGDLYTTGQIDYYKFTGTQGQGVAIIVQAQETAFDPEAIDTVVTVYDADKNVIARNDDMEPRVTNDSQVFMFLPADGDYYVTIEECWTWIENNAVNASCADPKDKVTTAYQLLVGEISTTADTFFKDEEKGDTAADATPISFIKGTNGFYQMTVLWGFFEGITDIDVFAISVPADFSADAGERGILYYAAMAAGADGNGSTTPIGVVSLASAATPDAILAETDFAAGGELTPPIQAGEDYLLFVRHPGKDKGDNDFYFSYAYISGSNPVETGDNETVAKAQVLSPSETQAALAGYFVEGDLDPDGDLDFFSFDIPAGAVSVSATCSAQRIGSGLRQFQLNLVNEAGAAIANGAASESLTKNASLTEVPVPNGATKLFLKVQAGSVDAKIAGRYYRCGVYVQ